MLILSFVSVLYFNGNNFSKLGITAKWWWKRCEYQKRGTVHIHGCLRLICDPGITEYAKKVLEARISEMLLNEFDGWRLVNSNITPTQLPADRKHSDVWETEFVRQKPNTWNEKSCTEHALNVEGGISTEECIVNFQNWFLTTMNTVCMIDCDKDKRDPSTFFDYSKPGAKHPCGRDPKIYFEEDNGFTSVRSKSELYAPAVNVVERHKCNGYCLRKNIKRKKTDPNDPPAVLNNMTVGVGKKY